MGGHGQETGPSEMGVGGHGQETGPGDYTPTGRPLSTCLPPTNLPIYQSPIYLPTTNPLNARTCSVIARSVGRRSMLEAPKKPAMPGMRARAEPT